MSIMKRRTWPNIAKECWQNSLNASHSQTLQVYLLFCELMTFGLNRVTWDYSKIYQLAESSTKWNMVISEHNIMHFISLLASNAKTYIKASYINTIVCFFDQVELYLNYIHPFCTDSLLAAKLALVQFFIFVLCMKEALFKFACCVPYNSIVIRKNK